MKGQIQLTDSLRLAVEQSQPAIDTTSLILKSCAAAVEFNEVNIKTLRSFYMEKLDDIVLSKIFPQPTETLSQYNKRLYKEYIKTIQTTPIHVREFVQVNENYNLTICISGNIIDDCLIDKIINYLTTLSLKPGSYFEFGPPRAFTVAEAQQQLHVKYTYSGSS